MNAIQPSGNDFGIQGQFGQGCQEKGEKAPLEHLLDTPGGTFRVRRYDERNWILEEWVRGRMNTRTKELAADHWEGIGYYGQLKDVAHHLLNKSITFADGTNGQQILTAIENAEKSITEGIGRIGITMA